MNASHEATKRRGQGALLLRGLVMLAAIALSGCRRGEDVSPPKIAYGQAECELCKMIISEEPFAAGAVVAMPDGVEKFAFDDIGCLLDFLREPTRTGRITPYVHDHATLVWLEASHAVFIRSDALQTPMASHLAACDSQNAAQDLLRRFPGSSIRFETLRTESARTLASDSTSSERTTP